MTTDAVLQRYGSTKEYIKQRINLRDSAGNLLELYETPTKGVLYFQCPDFLTGEVGIFPYMDNIIDYSDLEVGEDLGDGIRVRQNGLNKAVLDLTKTPTLDGWIGSIKVPNTIKRGTRYQETEKLYTSYAVADEESFVNLLDMFKSAFAEKERQFKLDPGTLRNGYILEYRALRTVGITVDWIHDIVSNVRGFDEPMFTWVAFQLSNEVMYAPFMLLTRNLGALSKYKPAVAAHIYMTEYAKKIGCKKVDYGHYYSYKNLLSFETEWVKGLERVQT